MRLVARPALARSLLVYCAVGLIVLFVGFLLYEKFWVGRVRFESNPDLFAELGTAILPDDSAAGEWSQWRGPNRVGVALYPGLLEDWPQGGPKKLWHAASEGGYSSFAVAGDRVFSMTGDEQKEAVVCWSFADGKELWRKSFESAIWERFPGPRATPTVVGDRLYTVSSHGVLVCLRTEKGSEVWRRDLKQELQAVPPRWGVSFSPLVHGDLVYAMVGGGRGRALAAFAKEDGKLVWSSQDDKPGYSSPVVAEIGGKTQIVFFTGERVVGVTPEKGDLLWSFPWADQFHVNAATPLVIAAKAPSGGRLDYVFISAGYDKGCAMLKIVAEGDKFEAVPVYTKSDFRCRFPSPVRYRDHVYGMDEKSDLTCMNLRTGEVAWRHVRKGREPSYMSGAMIRVNDRLLLLGETGKLALVACDPSGYQEIAASRPFRERCWSLPVLADGRLLLHGEYRKDEHRVICLDLRGAK